MRKSLLLALFILFLAPASFAQTTTTTDDGQGPEFYVGYSSLQSEGIGQFNTNRTEFENRVFGNRNGLNGINAAVTGFFSPRVGLTGDFSYHSKGQEFEVAGTGTNDEVDQDIRRFNLHVGPTVKFRNSSRVNPFVHTLAGIANTRFDVDTRSATTTTTGTTTTTTTTNRSFDTKSTDFSLMLGGGLDVRVSDRFAIRAIQLDYNPIFFRDRTIDRFSGTGVVQGNLEGQRADNVRIGFGVVFK